jgi:actin-like ATPase involved in cell morphogenesis
MNFSINPFTDDLAVDLGTVHTFIYGRGRGMIVNEPSLVAIDKISNEVIAVGNEADARRKTSKSRTRCRMVSWLTRSSRKRC